MSGKNNGSIRQQTYEHLVERSVHCRYEEQSNIGQRLEARARFGWVAKYLCRLIAIPIVTYYGVWGFFGLHVKSRMQKRKSNHRPPPTGKPTRG